VANFPNPEERIHQVEEPDPAGTYTASDYLNWTFEGLVELIRGKIYKMSPTPNLKHQRIAGLLYEQLCPVFKGHPCGLWIAPTDVYLVHPGEDYKKTHNIVEPDLFVVCDKSKLRSFGCVGAPDFIIEILSPSTSKKDIRFKRELYEEYGVKEYWMIQVTDRLVIVNRLEDGKYVTQRPYTVGNILSPQQFPELRIDLEKLFKGVEDIP